MKTLIIDRKKWGRGRTGGSLLTDEFSEVTGKMCCLGFFSRNCGFKPKEIRGIGLPEEVIENLMNDVDTYGTMTKAETKEKLFNKLKKRGFDLKSFKKIGTGLANKLALINDNTDTTDETKERKITELFGKVGIKVKFVN